MRYLFLLLILMAGACIVQSQETANIDHAPLTDDSLMTIIQEQAFRYFWEGAEENSGLARERFIESGIYPHNDRNVITSGGSGFGIMAILAGIERGFITREAAVERFEKILDFLEKVDRFHGAYAHWYHGDSMKVKPFGRFDDGGDIVETAFLVQGLLTARQYFRDGNAREQAIAARMDKIWREVDWDWYRGGENKENVLFWHWSPNHAFKKQFRIRGYNECLILYVLAAASPTHSVPAEVYHEGWAEGGKILGGPEKYGYSLSMRHQSGPNYGGPLFWAHYSFLGLNPRNLRDRYADYWEHNRNHVLIDREYCIENPKNYKGYSAECWGLTSSYTITGYSAHKPDNDLGVIAPTAALASIPYTPDYSLDAMRYFYEDLGERLIGRYGFYDAFSIHADWFPEKYLAIDQGPIVVMIENYRSGLLWDLFMSCEEVKNGLEKLGFTSY